MQQKENARERERELSVCFQVVIPLTSLQGTNRSSNPNNPAEKYIQVSTVDNHEFWFMGFVNYEKAARNLQEAPAYAN